MTTFKWSLLAVLVTGVGFLTAIRHTRSPYPGVGRANESARAGEQSKALVHQPSPLTTAPVRHRPAAVLVTPERTDASATDITPASADVMRVRADRPLAKVNDQAVLLKDLVPLQGDEQEHVMTPEEYQSRLERAIEMELTFKAAALQGVDLTPEQKKRVNGIAPRHDATLQEYRKQGINWSSVSEAQLQFEQRVTSALLLQQNLVVMEARVAPSSDPGVQARYEQARSQVLSRLKGRSNISISTVEL